MGVRVLKRASAGIDVSPPSRALLAAFMYDLPAHEKRGKRVSEHVEEKKRSVRASSRCSPPSKAMAIAPIKKPRPRAIYVRPKLCWLKPRISIQTTEKACGRTSR